MISFLQYSKIKELAYAEKLYEEGKYGEVFQVILNFEQKGDLTPFDRISCYLLKGSALVMLGRYDEVLTLAEQVYRESQKQGKKLQMIDAFILKARVLWYLGRLDDVLNVLDQGEKLLKTLTSESLLEINKREGWIAWIKSLTYKDKGELDLELKYLNQGLVLGEETGDIQIIFLCLMLKGFYFTSQGDLDRALTYVNRSQVIAKQLHNKMLMAFIFANLGFISFYRGKLDLALKYFEEALALFKKYNSNLHIATCLGIMGTIYLNKRDFERSLMYSEQSLALFGEIGNISYIADILTDLIILTIEKGDFSRSQQYFYRLKQINEKEENNMINLLYRYSKAFMLKKNPHTSNQNKARILFEQIVKEEIISIGITIDALIELCDLLLINLRDTSNIKLLDEIQLYLNRIMEITKNQKSYFLLAETYLLQARLELLTLDLQRAQQSLSEAQNIAEKYGLEVLALRISSEQDELQEQLSKWEDFKKSEANIVERMELARIDKQLIRMLRKRLYLDKTIF